MVMLLKIMYICHHLVNEIVMILIVGHNINNLTGNSPLLKAGG